MAELREDLRSGLHVFLTPRPGRFDRDQFKALAETLAAEPFDTRRVCLCTDDIPTDRLMTEGHLDHRIRVAIDAGIDPLTVIQMATINPATAMRIERDHGSISAGKFADIVLADDIATVKVDSVVHHGRLVVADGAYRHAPSPFRYPSWAKDTIRVAAPIDPASLVAHVAPSATSVTCNAIIQENGKQLRQVTLPVSDGAVACDPAQDVVHVAVLDRHTGSGRVGCGFAYGTGIRHGAIASTINHNAHNLFAIGRDAGDMAAALDRLIAIGGGYVMARDGKIVGELALPVIGMISEGTLEEVADGFRRAERRWPSSSAVPSRNSRCCASAFSARPSCRSSG